jgi:hypothetical protein
MLDNFLQRIPKPNFMKNHTNDSFADTAPQTDGLSVADTSQTEGRTDVVYTYGILHLLRKECQITKLEIQFVVLTRKKA